MRAEFEWFQQFGDIPGVTWEAPMAVTVDPRWAAARPRLKRFDDGELPATLVSWVDRSGRRFDEDPDPQALFGRQVITSGSPAAVAAGRVRGGGGLHQVLTELSTSFALPGTRNDYFEALESACRVLGALDDEEAERPAWRERLAWLAVSLLRQGVEAAARRAEDVDSQEGSLHQAGWPYSTLIAFYRREGYLQEAAALYAEAVDELPEEARPRWSEHLEPRLDQGVTTLRQIRAALEARPTVAARRSDRARNHAARWPEHLREYQELVGTFLGRVLRGESLLRFSWPAGSTPLTPARLQVDGLSQEERSLLATRLPPTAPPEGRRLARARLHRWAIALPRYVRTSPRWARNLFHDDFGTSIELEDGAAMLVARIVEPLMRDLAQIFEIRGGHGPKTSRGRIEAMERCLEVHEALGFETSAVMRLLDPELDADSVESTRTQLVQAWASHPEDLGARAMAYLSARLAEHYHRKARKDGTARRADVVNATGAPLLEATLGTWEALLAYLGEGMSPVDAQPVEVSGSVPAQPPPEIAERVEFVRRWWTEVFDPAHAEQEPGMPSLWGLVPESWKADPERSQGPPGYHPDQWWRRLPDGMKKRMDELWGSTVQAAHPGVLVDQPHSHIPFLSTLQPAVRVWESMALTCWFLCFGPFSRTTLDGLRQYHRAELAELEALGCPVDPQAFRDLVSSGSGMEFGGGRSLSITLSVQPGADGEPVVRAQGPGERRSPGAAEAFLRLRDVVTRHRRQWMAGSLDRFLASLWQRDLERADRSYRELFVGRGRPPTVKQAFPKLKHAAVTWFGGDFAALARALGIDGPVTEPMRRSALRLPADLLGLQRRILELLGPDRRRPGLRCVSPQRLRDLARSADDVLAAWQATGKMPARTAVSLDLLREVYPDQDPDEAWRTFLSALRQGLDEVGHPAADAPDS